MALLACLAVAGWAATSACAQQPESAAQEAHAAAAETYLTAIRAPQAWRSTSDCSGAVVAVVDSGVDASNPDLRGSVLPGWNALAGSSDTSDSAGHGTMVAGLIGARRSRGPAAAGVCSRARILPVVVWTARAKPTDASISAGITWATDHGATVINLSLGGAEASDSLRRAVEYALGKDVVVVAAAGNAYTDVPQYPAAFQGVLAVSASDAAGQRAPFSSHGAWVGVAAPGTEMLSTRGSSVAVSDGTSFAAPLVSGTAALLRTQHPEWTAAQVVRRIEETADDAGPFGPDPSFGHGILDVAAAVGAAAPRRLAIGAADRFEPDDLPAQAARVALGSPVRATFSPEGDADWYAVDVSRPTELSVYASPGDRPPADDYRSTALVVEAFGPGLELLADRDARWDGRQGALRVQFPAAAPGRYYLRVTNAYGSRGAYALHVKRSPLGSWAAWQDVYTGSEATAVAAGDVNGDGRADVVLASSQYFSPVYANQLVLFAQRPDGTLAPPAILPRLSRLCCGDVAVGDLNGDGESDVVATAGVNGLEVFTQGPSGLGPPTLVPTLSAAEEVAVLDGDLVVGEADGLHVLRRTGSGFADRRIDTASPLAVRVEDMNGDGRRDVIATEAKPNGIVIYLRGAGGRFTRQEVPVTATLPGAFTVGDLNGDRRSDLAIAVTGGIDVLYRRPDGFAPPALLRDADAPPLAVDLNRDGRTDLAAGNTVYLQAAGGRLASGRSDGCSQNGFGADTLAAADVNGDGRTDLLWAGGWGLVVVPQRSRWSAPATWIYSATPAPNTQRVAASASPAVRFARAVDPASVTVQTVKLLDAHGAAVQATISYEGASRTATLHPASPLDANTSYELEVSGIEDLNGNELDEPFIAGFFTGDLSPDA